MFSEITKLILHNLKHSIVISIFVLSMMTLVEYLNLISEGRIKIFIVKNRLFQYILTAFLGATPGCLGAFTVISLYIHGFVSFGSVVGTMIATSGDEAFVMISLFPKKAFIIFAFLFILGIIAAFVSDYVIKILKIETCAECKVLQIHKEELPDVIKFENIKKIHLSKILAIGIFGLFFILLVSKIMKLKPVFSIIFEIVILANILIFVFSSKHFIEEHILNHIIKTHLWKIFIWTFGTLFIVDLGLKFFDLKVFIKKHLHIVFISAILLGIIPESGPHLIFVSLFAKNLIPISVLIVNSIVQDGHGLLPLLSYSVKDSILIKIFNIIFAFITGLILHYLIHV